MSLWERRYNIIFACSMGFWSLVYALSFAFGDLENAGIPLMLAAGGWLIVRLIRLLPQEKPKNRFPVMFETDDCELLQIVGVDGQPVKQPDGQPVFIWKLKSKKKWWEFPTRHTYIERIQ